MHKKRNNKYNNLVDEFDFDGALSGRHRPSRKAGHRRWSRLVTKRRMDDHEEYLWKKRNGLFDDELYAGLDETPSASSVL